MSRWVVAGIDVMFFHHACLQCGSWAEHSHLYCIARCVRLSKQKQVSENKVLIKAADLEHSELNLITNRL